MIEFLWITLEYYGSAQSKKKKKKSRFLNLVYLCWD